MNRIKLKKRRLADAHLKCIEAVRLFDAHATKYADNGDEGRFKETCDALGRASAAIESAISLCDGRMRKRRFVTLPLSSLWGRITALCGQSFCHEMAAHMCRKFSLILGVLEKDERDEGSEGGGEVLATRLELAAFELDELAQFHRGQRRN